MKIVVAYFFEMLVAVYYTVRNKTEDH